MRFGAPQCGVSVELPTAAQGGWSRVSADALRNVWTVDAESHRDIFLFTASEIASWTSSFGENNPVRALPSGTAPIASIERGDAVTSIIHGDGSHASWTWVVTRYGSVLLLDAIGRAVLSNHTLGSQVTATCRMGTSDVVLSSHASSSEYSEVIELRYSADDPRGPVTAKGKALFRLGDRVECMCIAKTSSNDPNASVVSGRGEMTDRHLLFSVTEHGNIDVWDLASGCDATAEFHDLHYSTEDLGSPTCVALVGSALWIGTAFGPVVVCPIAASGTYQTLQHHKARVTSIFSMTLGTRVWSCCADGVVAVWSVARRKPCGQFDIQATPMLSLQNSTPQLLTAVWGVDARHHATCWEVREDFAGGTPLNLDEAGRATSPRRRDMREAWVGFVGSLCDVLTGRAKECEFPPMLMSETDAPPEARYLPDALVSLSECREMIFETFRDLEWHSVSLSEDVKLLAKQARGHKRAYNRARDIAGKLSSLTPAFPLPEHINDPVERLVIAAECVLEEVMDQGVLRDPRHANSEPDKGGADLDKSVIPEAQTLSEHIFETQMKALEQQLDDERKLSASVKRDLKRQEDENDRLVAEVAEAREQVVRLSSDAERWRKAHIASKKRLQSAQQLFDAEKMALAQDLDAARLELRGANPNGPAAVAAGRKLSWESLRGDADGIVRELAHMLNRSCEEQRSVRAAAMDVMEELAETKRSFRDMEDSGKRMIHGFEQERIRAIEDLTNLQRQMSTRSVGMDHVQRQLQHIIATMRGEDAAPAATPPRGPLRVAF